MSDQTQTPEAVITVFRNMSAEDNPFTSDDAILHFGLAEATQLGDKLTTIAHAVADYIEYAKTVGAYDDARSTLETVAHVWPIDEDGDDDDEPDMMNLADVLRGLQAALADEASE